MVVHHPIEPRVHRWSTAEFREMARLGWFFDRNVELIDGEIVEMPPQGPVHYAATDQAYRLLSACFGPGRWVRCQAPLSLADGKEPNPDISVVAGRREDFLDHHPATAVLAVEVSDSTLRYDRQIKGEMYARAGIPEYWIINLEDGRLEVFRRPEPDAARPDRFCFGESLVLKPGDSIQPLDLGSAPIQVAELFPR